MEAQLPRQLVGGGGLACPLGEVFEHPAGVVGATEEGAVDTLGDTAMGARTGPDHGAAEGRDDHELLVEFLFVSERDHARHLRDEQHRYDDADQPHQDREAALHQKVARATP